jgi:hypothetical protein
VSYHQSLAGESALGSRHQKALVERRELAWLPHIFICPVVIDGQRPDPIAAAKLFT